MKNKFEHRGFIYNIEKRIPKIGDYFFFFICLLKCDSEQESQECVVVSTNDPKLIADGVASITSPPNAMEGSNRIGKDANERGATYIRISEYIKKMNYDWSVSEILSEYEKKQRGEYISHSANDVIKNAIESPKEELTLSVDAGKECAFTLERINLLISLSGKSQMEICRELGISKGRLNHYLKGKRKFDDIIKHSICKLFGVDERILTQHTIHLTIKGSKIFIL